MKQTVDIQKFVVKPDDTLLHTLRVIDSGAREIALVVDDDLLLLGTVTDGDIRRGLLRGLDLSARVTNVAHQDFTAVGPDTSRQDALDLMLARRLKVLPVLDQDGRVLSLMTLHDTVAGTRRPNAAVIMAGGKGTRLRPFTETLPKPMLPIGDRPMLERIVIHLVSHGIHRIFISIGYLGRMIEDHFGDGSEWNCEISYLREEEPLGTGGCLALMSERPTHPILVMNGDVLTRLHVGRLLDYHARGDFAATMGVRDYEVRVPYGVAEVENGALTRLVEKPAVSYLINAGIYVLNPQVLDLVPEPDGVFPITHLFERVLERGEKVGAFDIQEEWADVGQTEHYFRHHSPPDDKTGDDDS